MLNKVMKTILSISTFSISSVIDSVKFHSCLIRKSNKDNLSSFSKFETLKELNSNNKFGPKISEELEQMFANKFANLASL